MRSERLYAFLAVLVLALAAGPVGTSAYWLGFVQGESPCVLCWAQRTGMALIALTGAFILRFGPRPRYIGMGLLIALHGVFMGLRHSALHLGRDIGQGFAAEILGAHTYTWSVAIFWAAAAVMGLLLLLTRDEELRGTRRDPGLLGRLAICAVLVAAAGNAAQAFMSTGPPPYMGQSSPVRFSFDPSHWVWSLEEWRPAPLGWRGRYDVPRPSVEGLPGDAQAGPLAGLEPLAARRELRVGAALGGALTDLACDPAGDRCLVTTDAHGVLVLDGGLQKVLRQALVDPGYSVDVGDFVGAAFAGERRVAALGHNKSYVLLEENDAPDAGSNFRFFRQPSVGLYEAARGRFATVRARLSYVMSLAYDAGSDSFFTVTVPSRRHPALVVSRFSRSDMTLSEEFRPRLAAGLALAGAKRSLDEYYVTGLAAAEGRLYALSAAYATVLVIDPARREVVAARAVPAPARPVGLAVKGQQLWLAGADGRVVVVDRP